MSTEKPSPEDVGQEKKPNIVDAVVAADWSLLSLERLANTPCATNGLISGASAGVILGFARYFATKNRRSAEKWGVLTFAVIATVSWEFCRFQRKVANEELQKMMQASPKK